MAAIDCQLAALASHAPADKRLTALKYAVHLVGDIHQPLHAGYAEDRGGNFFQLQAFMRGSNQHALWDVGLIMNLDMSNDGQAACQAGPGRRIQCRGRGRRVLPNCRNAGVLSGSYGRCTVHRAVHAGDGGAAEIGWGEAGRIVEHGIPVGCGRAVASGRLTWPLQRIGRKSRQGFCEPRPAWIVGPGMVRWRDSCTTAKV